VVPDDQAMKVSHQIEGLNEVIAEAEDLCVEFAIESHRETTPHADRNGFQKQ
jgi:hypothetical protein